MAFLLYFLTSSHLCSIKEQSFLAKLCQPLSCFILHSKAKLACYFRYLLISYFCIRSSMMKRISIFGVLGGLLGHHRTVQLQLLHHWARTQTWITVILNGLPWKGTEIILLFLRLHRSIAFQTLLLTMRAYSISSKDSCPQ